MKNILRKLGILGPLPPIVAPKPKKAPRISVHLPTGQTVVHYGHSRIIYDTGRLTVFWKPLDKDDGVVVADYAPGAWSSVSVGKRNVKGK